MVGNTIHPCLNPLWTSKQSVRDLLSIRHCQIHVAPWHRGRYHSVNTVRGFLDIYEVFKRVLLEAHMVFDIQVWEFWQHHSLRKPFFSLHRFSSNHAISLSFKILQWIAGRCLCNLLGTVIVHFPCKTSYKQSRIYSYIHYLIYAWVLLRTRVNLRMFLHIVMRSVWQMRVILQAAYAAI